MALLDPMAAVENLIYIGYAGDPSSTIRVTRRRRLDRKKQQSDRNVYQCFVFGPKEAGKSAILNSFVGRCVHVFFSLLFLKLLVMRLFFNFKWIGNVFGLPIPKKKNRKKPNKFDCSFNCRSFSEEYESNADDRYAVNIVRLPGVTKISSICLPDREIGWCLKWNLVMGIFTLLSFDLFTRLKLWVGK